MNMLFILSIIAYACLFFYLCWRRLDWGLYLVIAISPLYVVRFSVGPLPSTLLELSLLILFFVWFVKDIAWLRWRDAMSFLLLNRIFSIGLLCFLIASLLGIIVAQDSWGALGLWRAYFLEPLLLFIVLLDVVRTRRQVGAILGSLFVGAVIVLVGAYIQYMWGIGIPPAWAELRRVVSVYPFPNAVGLYLAPIVMLFFSYSVYAWSRFSRGVSRVMVRLLLGVGLCLAVGGIVLSQTEAGLLALAGGILLYFLFWSARTRLWAFELVALVSLFFFSLPRVGVFVWEKVTLQDWSGLVRLGLWGEASYLLQDHWLFGAGLGGFRDAFAPYHYVDYVEIFMFPHQLFLNVWSELGLVGLIGFVLLVVWYLSQSWRLFTACTDMWWRSLGLGFFCVMCVILFHGLFDVPYFKNDLAVVWWVFFALLFVSHKIVRDERLLLE